MRIILFLLLFLSCKNDPKVVQEFFSGKELPIEQLKEVELIQTENGNIKVKIIANNIELLSEGNPSRGKGNISLNASGDLRSKSNSIDLEAADIATLFGEDEVVIQSSNKVSIIGEEKIDEGHDAGTIISSLGAGSKTPKQWIKVIEKLTDIK